MFKYGLPLSNSLGLDLDLTDLTDEFGKILNKFGLIVDHYHAFSDPITGDIFINLSDEEGDSIDAIMMVDDDGIPGCFILDKNDRGVGWIDLEGIAPISNDRISFSSSWFRYSILTNLLKLGEVDFEQIKESKSKGVVRTITKIEEAFTVKGSNKIAVVSHRKRHRALTTRQQLGLVSVRRKLQRNDVKLENPNDRVTKIERHISKFLKDK